MDPWPGLWPSKQLALTDAHVLVSEMRSGTASNCKLLQGHMALWSCPSAHDPSQENWKSCVCLIPFFSLPQPTLPTAGDSQLVTAFSPLRAVGTSFYLCHILVLSLDTQVL